MKVRLRKLFGAVRDRLKARFESLWKALKPFLKDYRFYILLAFSLGSILCSAFVFRVSFWRLIEGFRDLWSSSKYYISYEFYLDWDVEATVANLSNYYAEGTGVLIPETWEEFTVKWSAYWSLWADSDNFLGYLSLLSDILFYVAQFATIVAPLFFIVWFIFNKYINNHNNDYNKNSKPLRLWYKIRDKIITPVARWFKRFWDFIKSVPLWWKSFLFIWAYNFNFLGIAVEFFAFYFYFCASFDFKTIYIQVYKLLLDLNVVFAVVPLVIWIIGAVIVLDLLAYRSGDKKLAHMENRNRGFINERSIITFVCGTMGKGKTTAITDMALSESVQMHDDCMEILLDIDFEFYRFPWQNFGLWLKRLFTAHKIYSPYMARQAVRKIFVFRDMVAKYPQYRKNLMRRLRKELFYTWGNFYFDYDTEHNPVTFDNGLHVVTIEKALEDYAQAYFVYIIQTSLILSNYSIRGDEQILDLGNFPLWDSNFFRKNKARFVKSHFSKILDFDMLRLGRKMVKDNPHFNAFGCGVYVISEIDKERQNALSTNELKYKDVECNQKNDMFNEMLKMVRHGAVIRNKPFIKFFVDAQRPEDWGASAREVAEVVHIEDRLEPMLMLPWYAPFRLFELFYLLIFPKVQKNYVDYSFSRADNTLFMHGVKYIGAKLKHRYERVYNRYGCMLLKLSLESGKLDGEYTEARYYLNIAKIYNDRFNTAAQSGLFEKIASRATIGINDLAAYGSTTATENELEQGNSHFIKRIHKYSDDLDVKVR